MKLTKILPLLPMMALLAACGTEVKLSSNQDQMVSGKQTEAPTNFVVYPDDRPSVVDGRALFEKNNCASCHGAAGVGGNGPALNDKRKMSTVKPVELYQFLTFGKPGVNHPILKDTLSNKEIWNLVVYSKALGTPPLSDADLAVMSPVFGSNCAVCHGTKGDGEGPLAHNLEPNPANFTTSRRFFDRTDDVLYDHIANGIYFEGMPNFLGKEDRKKNFKFDHDNIRKLVQYVRNFSINGDGFTVASASGNASTSAPAASAAPAAGAAASPAVPAASGTPSSTPAAGSAPNGGSTPGAGDASTVPAKPATETPVPGEKEKAAAETKTGSAGVPAKENVETKK